MAQLLLGPVLVVQLLSLEPFFQLPEPAGTLIDAGRQIGVTR